MANIWHGVEADTALEVVPGRHHFNIIADLADAEKPACCAACP
ncbi:MAG: hypothetical protein U1E15_08045 [Hyphomicrobiales bacterium]